jgi:hypothetical protein
MSKSDESGFVPIGTIRRQHRLQIPEFTGEASRQYTRWTAVEFAQQTPVRGLPGEKLIGIPGHILFRCAVRAQSGFKATGGFGLCRSCRGRWPAFGEFVV